MFLGYVASLGLSHENLIKQIMIENTGRREESISVCKHLPKPATQVDKDSFDMIDR